MLSFVAIADYRKARLRAMAAEVATSLAPPQGVAATGGAPSEFTETGAEGKIPGVDRVPPTRKMAKSVSFKHAALCIELAASERRILKISAKQGTQESQNPMYGIIGFGGTKPGLGEAT